MPWPTYINNLNVSFLQYLHLPVRGRQQIYTVYCKWLLSSVTQVAEFGRHWWRRFLSHRRGMEALWGLKSTIVLTWKIFPMYCELWLVLETHRFILWGKLRRVPSASPSMPFLVVTHNSASRFKNQNWYIKSLVAHFAPHPFWNNVTFFTIPLHIPMSNLQRHYQPDGQWQVRFFIAINL